MTNTYNGKFRLPHRVFLGSGKNRTCVFGLTAFLNRKKGLANSGSIRAFAKTLFLKREGNRLFESIFTWSGCKHLQRKNYLPAILGAIFERIFTC